MSQKSRAPVDMSCIFNMSDILHIHIYVYTYVMLERDRYIYIYITYVTIHVYVFFVVNYQLMVEML